MATHTGPFAAGLGVIALVMGLSAASLEAYRVRQFNEVRKTVRLRRLELIAKLNDQPGESHDG